MSITQRIEQIVNELTTPTSSSITEASGLECVMAVEAKKVVSTNEQPLLKFDDHDDEEKNVLVCLVRDRTTPHLSALMVMSKKNEPLDHDDEDDEEEVVVVVDYVIDEFHVIHCDQEIFSIEMQDELGMGVTIRNKQQESPATKQLYTLESPIGGQTVLLTEFVGKIGTQVEAFEQGHRISKRAKTLDIFTAQWQTWESYYKESLVGSHVQLPPFEIGSLHADNLASRLKSKMKLSRSTSLMTADKSTTTVDTDSNTDSSSGSGDGNGDHTRPEKRGMGKLKRLATVAKDGRRSRSKTLTPKSMIPKQTDSPRGHKTTKSSKPKSGLLKGKSSLGFSSVPEIDDSELFGARGHAKRDHHKSFAESISTRAKEQWIRKHLKLRSDEFTEKTTIKTVVGTWNVGSKPLNPSSNICLAQWLHTDQFEADIYAIGLQEIDMTAGALLRESTDAGNNWTNLISSFFETIETPYEILEWKQLVGLYTCVVVKKDLKPHITDVRVTAEGVGVLGMMGNKGGVAVRFQLHETTFCFINVHLAAHTGAVSQRNQNFHDIIRRTMFNGGSSYHPESHDHLFIFGDLNYRLQLQDVECRELVEKGDIETLLKNDQLMQEKKAGRVLVGYEEGPITFLPTYKFDIGTLDRYDSSEKRRVPSYTDRILWRKNRSISVEQTFYKMLPEYITSDHKPVVAGFDVDVNVIEESKYRACYRELLKMLDKMENDMLPEVELSSTELVFEHVMYQIPVKRTIRLVNTGQVVCEFSFLPKPDTDMVAKKWIQIEPITGIIIPGETAELKITVYVDHTTAPALNHGKDSIDDILILHLKNGRDHFISISGKFLHSCFGNSLTRLVKMHKSVREYQDTHPNGEMPDEGKEDLKIPKELWRMVDYIYRHGMEEPDLFKESGDPCEVSDIRERLDTGQSLENFPGSIQSMAEAMIGFLESLSEPVIPKKFYTSCISSCNDFEMCNVALSFLPPEHFNVFHYVVALLRERLYRCKHNRTTADELAIIFSRVMLRHPREVVPSANEQAAAARFVKQFLRPDINWSQEEILK